MRIGIFCRIAILGGLVTPGLATAVSTSYDAGLGATDFNNKTCPLSLSSLLSCHNTTAVQNTCCFNAPGGLLVQTQLWHKLGPADSWTIHGLWPDNCDGSFAANCDQSRADADIRGILKRFGKDDLLDYMETHWKRVGGSDEILWQHEWAKHGTCISTFNPECYSGYRPNEEVVDYFQKSVDLFKSLNTYKILGEAGIYPDAERTYNAFDIKTAVVNAFGKNASIKCKQKVLQEVWYHFHVKGTAQTGEYVPTDPVGASSYSNCRGQIKYLPKSTLGDGDGGNTYGSGPTSRDPQPQGEETP